jgi:hypothetical protein
LTRWSAQSRDLGYDLRMRALPVLSAAGIMLGIALSAAPAAAQYPDAAPVRPLVSSDLAGLTTIDFDLQLTRWRQPLAPNVEERLTVLTFDLAADIQIAPHWLIVARVPFASSDIELRPADTTTCCGLSLGNLTLGGRWLYSSRQTEIRTVAGGELTMSFATANDRDDRGTGAALAAFAWQTHDPALYLPNAWTPRLTGFAQIYGRWFLVQGEAGLHLLLYDGDVKGDSGDLAVRLALAGGVRVTPELAVMVDVNSMIFVDDEADGSSTSLDVGLRYGGRNLLAALRLFLPIDDSLRSADMIGFGGDVGVRF